MPNGNSVQVLFPNGSLAHAECCPCKRPRLLIHPAAAGGPNTCTFVQKQYWNETHAKRVTALRGHEPYELEVGILQRLSDLTLPPNCTGHLPRLLRRDDVHMVWRTTWGGHVVARGSPGNRAFCLLRVEEVGRQANCIEGALARARVVHLDLGVKGASRHGKNLAVLNGKINLFDFDVAVMDENPKSPKLEKRFSESRGYSVAARILRLHAELCALG